MAIELRPYPDLPAPALRLRARVARIAPDGCRVLFLLTGDLAAVRLPAAEPARRVDELWRHTCFEVFAASPDRLAYHEFNAAPSGHWAAYAFREYRARDPARDPALAPGLRIRRGVGGLALALTLPRALLPPAAGTTPVWQLGLTAVIEAVDGTLSYWALHHPGSRPDFHHQAGFQLVLDGA